MIEEINNEYLYMDKLDKATIVAHLKRVNVLQKPITFEVSTEEGFFLVNYFPISDIMIAIKAEEL